jgi:hypothetical protein
VCKTEKFDGCDPQEYEDIENENAVRKLKKPAE